MSGFHLPYVHLPKELVELLKINLSNNNVLDEILSKIQGNRPLNLLIETTFPEFYESKKLEKMISALGWSSFRNRLTSLYIRKAQTGKFPDRTDINSVAEICDFEQRFIQYGMSGFSRAYLLGLYLSLANLSVRNNQGVKPIMLRIPEQVDLFLRFSQNRSERVDLLILVLSHLYHALGDEFLLSALAQGKAIDELYEILAFDFRRQMSDNLLAYSASINEVDTFLYRKV